MKILAYWKSDSLNKKKMALIGPIVLIACFLAVSGFAFEDPKHGLQIHGFISQGYVLTSDNNFCGDSDDHGTFDFRELGINASYLPFRSLQLSAQILSRTAGESDDGDIRLDYGLIDYSFLDKDTDKWGLRVGRIKTPYGLYNKTRDVAFTRPSIFLPQSIYFDRTRDLALSVDGVYVYGEHRADLGNFFLELGASRPNVKSREIEYAVLGSDFPGRLDDDTSYNGQIGYEKDGGLIRLALTWAQLNMDYDPAQTPPDDLCAGSIRFEPLIVSAQLNQKDWSLTAEYALRRVNYKDFGYYLVPDRTITGESYYLQGTYRVLNNLEGVVRYDILFSNRDDRDGKKVERAGRPDHSVFAKDLTFGLRWDITKSLMLRGEYHCVNGTAWLTREDNPDPSETKQYWNLFSILMAYYF
jgi:hypothetical protein